MLHRTAATTALALAGCAALTGVDALREGPGDLGDSGVTDSGAMDTATSPSDAGTTDAGGPLDAMLDADGGVSLIVNGGFEQGCVAPWRSYQGFLSDSSIAHTGSNACLVCVDPGRTLYTLDESDGFVANPLMGDTYLAEAWVRLGPDAGRTKTVATIDQRIFGNGTQLDWTEGQPQLPLTSTWQKVSVTYTVGVSGGSFLNVYVPAYMATTGDCFLVDDVALYKQ